MRRNGVSKTTFTFTFTFISEALNNSAQCEWGQFARFWEPNRTRDATYPPTKSRVGRRGAARDWRPPALHLHTGNQNSLRGISRTWCYGEGKKVAIIFGHEKADSDSEKV